MSKKKKPEQEPLPESEWTTHDAIQWLFFRARKHKFGTNAFQHVLDVVRMLNAERAQFRREIEKKDEEIARLQILKTPVPYDVGGQGPWGVK